MYPQLFHVWGPLWIQSYGVMIILGVLTSLWLIYRDKRRKVILSDDDFFSAAFWGLFSGLVGGRILFVVAHLSEYLESPWEFFYVWEGGFAILGAMIGAVIGVWFSLGKSWVRTLKVSDIVVLYAPLAQVSGRLGCLLAGCCYGKVLEQATWWSITFSNQDSLIPGYLLGMPLYPTQLFLAASSLGIFFVLQMCASRLIDRSGALLALYFLLESIARIGIDFFRDDRVIAVRFLVGGISIFQIYSCIAAVVSLLVFWWCFQQKRVV